MKKYISILLILLLAIPIFTLTASAAGEWHDYADFNKEDLPTIPEDWQRSYYVIFGNPTTGSYYYVGNNTPFYVKFDSQNGYDIPESVEYIEFCDKDGMGLYTGAEKENGYVYNQFVHGVLHPSIGDEWQDYDTKGATLQQSNLYTNYYSNFNISTVNDDVFFYQTAKLLTVPLTKELGTAVWKVAIPDLLTAVKMMMVCLVGWLTLRKAWEFLRSQLSTA